MARGIGRFLARAVVASALFGIALAPSAAHATVTFHVGPGAVQPDENVLYNRPELQHTGFHVQGHTNQTNNLVGIDGNVSLYANGGQSRIDTEAKDDDLRQLRFYFEDPKLTFKEIEFNINAVADGSVTIIANGGFGSMSRQFSVDRAGQNFFSLDASGNDYFTSVEFVTNVRVQDLKQLRIGGITQLDEDNPTGSTGDLAPEGGSGLMLAFGMLPMGLVVLRTRRLRV